MKITLSQCTSAVRDAGEMAFGILVFAILFFPLAVFAACVSAVAVIIVPVIFGYENPFTLIPDKWKQVIEWSAVSCWWLVGMIPVCIRYRKIGRAWEGERRGTNTLTLVELVSALGKFGASLAVSHNVSDAATGFNQKICLSVFLLLVGSHIGTYALLRYRPGRKELVLWFCIAVGFYVENFLMS